MTKPILKWAGGKSSVLAEIEKRLSMIDTNNATFYDVFVGGGSVAIKFESLFKKVVINDKNKELINTYNSVKNNPVQVANHLSNMEKSHAHDYYYKVREQDRLSDFNTLDDTYKAARMIYLNKTCFNGLYRVNSKGYFNVPLGRQSRISIYDEENIKQFSDFLSRVVIYNKDFSSVLKECKKGDVVYFDPPYDKINPNSFIQYNPIIFDEFDQQRLVDEINILTEKGVFVIASNSYTDYTLKIYEKYIDSNSIIMVRRNIASKNVSRKPVKELLIDNIKEVLKNDNYT